MRCARLTAIGRLRVEETAVPRAASGEVRLRVIACALCRTDAKMWRSGHRDLVLPRVLGHEVVAADEASGARFVIWPGSACGACRWCRSGRQNLCPEMKILGFHRDGGLAEWVIAPAAALVPVPDELPAAVAALAEPLACTLNALDQVAVSAADRVLIIGGGPVGLLAALAVRNRGAEPFVLERDPRRLRRSQAYRQALACEAAESPGDLPDFDVAINAAPTSAALETAVDRLRPAGRLALFSGLTGTAAVAVAVINSIHYRQLQLAGAYGCTREQMVRAVSLLNAHGGQVARLIEGEISLDQVEAALAAILDGEVMKVLVRT